MITYCIFWTLTSVEHCIRHALYSSYIHSSIRMEIWVLINLNVLVVTSLLDSVFHRSSGGSLSVGFTVLRPSHFPRTGKHHLPCFPIWWLVCHCESGFVTVLWWTPTGDSRVFLLKQADIEVESLANRRSERCASGNTYRVCCSSSAFQLLDLACTGVWVSFQDSKSSSLVKQIRNYNSGRSYR